MQNKSTTRGKNLYFYLLAIMCGKSKYIINSSLVFSKKCKIPTVLAEILSNYHYTCIK